MEKKKPKIVKYLSIFSRRKYPDNYKTLLKFAKMKFSKKDGIVEYAVYALKHFSGNDIRKFVTGKLKQSTSPFIFTSLLVNNYKKGDARILTSIVENTKNTHIIHNLASDYIEIYKSNKTKECRKPLEKIYNKLTCGICRKKIVEILKDNDVLSEKINREIKFDCFEETRLLAS